MKPLSATARLQFHKDFTLADAEKLVPYFDRLGISHLYASPLLTARAGSTHGYDIVDHNRINPELGGEDALRSLVARLRAHGMGLILDIVPNHMGVGGHDNAWWLDVLEWGRASPYAEYFDIDWDPADASMRGRLLAPFLGAPYGEALANGELQLKFDEATGRLFVGYHDHRFPISPRDYGSVLLTEGGVLEAPARLFNELDGPDARAHAAEARRELRLPAYAKAIAETLRDYDARTPAGQDRLHRLLDRQAWRLTWWRAATDEINWRRFFDVNGLAGVRVELPEVFEDTHRTVFRLYEQGLIDGVRIDHVDGLAYPREYCRKLRRRLDALTPTRPEGLRDARAVLWVEKILFAHERLSPDWHTDGTTGYDFMNDVAARPARPGRRGPAHRVLDRHHRPPRRLRDGSPGRPPPDPARKPQQRARLRRRRPAPRRQARPAHPRLHPHRHPHDADRAAGPLPHLPHLRRPRRHRRRGSARDGLGHGRRPPHGARRGPPPAGARRRLGLRRPACAPCRAGTRRGEWLRAMVKFQQLSAPTAAKSVEDTAFYRYGRLISRNEVGSEPSQFALSPAGFHAANRERQKRFPAALLATATHDHKRGEDTRLRLAVLSGLPDDWATAVQRWMRLNAPLRRDLDGPAPDAADELMLYQTLVAAWPLGLAPDDAAGLDAFRERVGAWLQKALREAKRHSGWVAPDTEYEAAAAALLAGSLDPARPVAAEIAAMAARLAVPGALSGLSQAVLRMTAPGIPDLYQGTEFWDLSLVDPDNRRPVDFAAPRRGTRRRCRPRRPAAALGATAGSSSPSSPASWRCAPAARRCSPPAPIRLCGLKDPWPTIFLPLPARTMPGPPSWRSPAARPA